MNQNLHDKKLVFVKETGNNIPPSRCTSPYKPGEAEREKDHPQVPNAQPSRITRTVSFSQAQQSNESRLMSSATCQGSRQAQNRTCTGCSPSSRLQPTSTHAHFTDLVQVSRRSPLSKEPSTSGCRCAKAVARRVSNFVLVIPAVYSEGIYKSAKLLGKATAHPAPILCFVPHTVQSRALPQLPGRHVVPNGVMDGNPSLNALPGAED
ncbi:hypothetical protein B0H65DRAFT_535651 [Neurospora tetraspora]|uniref:Uncharacterized protein n=1 Tax=Neurospora tetraspora TaxID=94610 RepID=A0AAE0JNJ9_9PEZI|nr:hypothetical protein B0H65DRAFT_535651 [Neurospora tetraspora]